MTRPATPKPLLLRLYAGATALIEPGLPILLKRRMDRGKEDPFRLQERLGRASVPRPDGLLVWLHGASVGESLSHLPLVERLVRERPEVNVLVTSGTRTSAQLLEQRLPANVIHQYSPLDAPAAAARFVEAWQPDLAIFVESELWPNLLFAAKTSGTRLALMSARLSERSRGGWDRAPGVARSLLGLFDLITVQDEDTGRWIARHTGAEPMRLDLKRLASPLPVDEDELQRLQRVLAGRRVLLAASTHPGEEQRVAEVLQYLPDPPLLIIVPRHPERGGAVESLLLGMGLRTLRRSERPTPLPDTQAYVADTLGELGLFYRLADAAILGGSLVEGLSGHNPLEPARLGKAVVAGDHVQSFRGVYDELKSRQAVLIAHGPAEFASAVAAVVTEPALARTLGERAREVCAAEQGPFDAAWDALMRLLPPR